MHVQIYCIKYGSKKQTFKNASAFRATLSTRELHTLLEHSPQKRVLLLPGGQNGPCFPQHNSEHWGRSSQITL